MTFGQYIRDLLKRTWRESFSTTRVIVFLAVPAVAAIHDLLIQSFSIEGWKIVLYVWLGLLLYKLIVVPYHMLREAVKVSDAEREAIEGRANQQVLRKETHLDETITELQNAYREIKCLNGQLKIVYDRESKVECLSTILMDATCLFHREVVDQTLNGWLFDCGTWESEATKKIADAVSPSAAMRFGISTGIHSREIETSRQYVNGPHLQKKARLADQIDNLKTLIADYSRPG